MRGYRRGDLPLTPRLPLISPRVLARRRLGVACLACSPAVDARAGAPLG